MKQLRGVNKKNISPNIFPVILQEEQTGGYTVINPAFEGCYSQGDTIEEALNNIREATELCFEEMKASSSMVPLKNINLHLISMNA